MRQKLRLRRPGHATVVAYLALFVALGGTGAWATHEVILSSDIVDGEVKTPDLANVGVTAPKLATGAVTNAKLAANAVTGAKVFDNSLTGADINEASLGTVPNASKVGGIGPSALTRGRTVASSCDPAPHPSDFTDCGTVTITTTTSSRFLIVASAMWHSNTAPSSGTCRIELGGTALAPAARPGEVTDNSSPTSQQSLTITTVAGPLPPEAYPFRLGCKDDELAGDIVVDRSYVSVVAIGSA
jgi:hypothetical protein